MSTSTKSGGESAEKVDSQPLLVAVSEENLAALLRATASYTEPEVQRLAEDGEAAAQATAADDMSAASQPKPSPSCDAPPQSPPVEAAESTLALFAAVKDHRSAMLSRVNSVVPVDLPSVEKVDPIRGPAERYEALSVSLPLKGVPLRVTLPQPLMPPPTASIATPSMGREQSHNTPWTSLVIGFFIVAAAGVGVSTFLTGKHTSTASRAVPTPLRDDIPLQMQVEQLGKGLVNVRWNPQSSPIAHARDGRLMITGRDQQPQIIPLNPQQLTTGHVSYRSSAEWLQFELEIEDNSGRVSSQAIVTLSSKPPPEVTSVAPLSMANLQSQARSGESIPISRADADALQLAKAMEARADRPPAPRVFMAPPSSGGRARQVPEITFDQLPIITGVTDHPPMLGPPVTLTNLKAPSASEPPVTKQVRVGGSLQAASLIRAVPPHYPPIAMSAHIEGTVRFTALIGKDGTVRNLQLISGNQMLIKAATDAVKQWTYRPTLLNGDPVEVITQVDVSFTLK